MRLRRLRASPVVHVHTVEHLPRPADGAAEGLTGVAGLELTVVVELLHRRARGWVLADTEGRDHESNGQGR